MIFLWSKKCASPSIRYYIFSFNANSILILFDDMILSPHVALLHEKRVQQFTRKVNSSVWWSDRKKTLPEDKSIFVSELRLILFQWDASGKKCFSCQHNPFVTSTCTPQYSTAFRYLTNQKQHKKIIMIKKKIFGTNRNYKTRLTMIVVLYIYVPNIFFFIMIIFLKTFYIMTHVSHNTIHETGR